ncbi:MAG: heavy-metal-associated domain-containing protein [Chloroflexota bacterium]|nr:heavy-metal-associated domain-containing protein [Chloroflexota bacterium]
MNVDLKSQTATVVFDPTLTDPSALREAVERVGYKPKSEAVTEG